MITLGKYELHEELGRGGFGTVYRAEDTVLGREVALKVLHPQLTTDPDFLKKFHNEARMMATLDSSNIVTIHDLGEEDGRVFIAMRYMAGGSLKQHLKEKGAITYEETIRIITHVCQGLQAAHAQGLIHRDIKPANILFDSEGNAAISDFGLARAVQQSSVSTASSAGSVGTPAYRAPELWRGKPPASPATDIYSLGCVLYEMLTGKVLFDGETPDEVITQHLVDGPQIYEQIHQGMRAIIQKMVEKEPQARYQTVNNALADMEESNGFAYEESQKIIVRGIKEVPNHDRRYKATPNERKLRKNQKKKIAILIILVIVIFVIIPYFVIEITDQWCNFFSVLLNNINPGACP